MVKFLNIIINHPQEVIQVQQEQFIKYKINIIGKIWLKILLNYILRIYNPEACNTGVYINASQWGFGAVLLQTDGDDSCLNPVCYMSKKTTKAQQKFHSYELEVLAIVKTLKKFRVYMLGLHFKIVTDCAAFTKTLEKRELATRVARWTLLMDEYDYDIEHRTGSQLPHVDSLSRYPMCIAIHSF